MTIVLTGGGSGGHITPLLAVAHALKQQNPDLKLVYLGQKGDILLDVLRQDDNIAEIYTIRAGKWRRYHGAGLKQLLDFPTMLKNLRDLVYLLVGIWQSRHLLKKIHPKAVFIKGGFVGLPVGLASASLHIPYVTHDSDALPGLANRLIAPWATAHAVALPKENYAYPSDKTFTTGIPLAAGFKPLTAKLFRQYREEIGLGLDQQVILVTGGGLGADRLNRALVVSAYSLLTRYPKLVIIHVAGRRHEDSITLEYDRTLDAKLRSRVKVYGFLTDVYRYSGAADLVITRAGATTIAELALQGKPCLIVPNPYLTGGHQLKNAELLRRTDAAVILPESILAQPDRLSESIYLLLDEPEVRQKLAKNIQLFGNPDAANDLAKLILENSSMVHGKNK